MVWDVRLLHPFYAEGRLSVELTGTLRGGQGNPLSSSNKSENGSV